MTRKKTNRLHLVRDGASIVIANTFSVTADYVRKVIRDTNHSKYKGVKPQAIRRAYLKYKHSKEAIIAQLQEYKRTGSNKNVA